MNVNLPRGEGYEPPTPTPITNPSIKNSNEKNSLEGTGFSERTESREHSARLNFKGLDIKVTMEMVEYNRNAEKEFPVAFSKYPKAKVFDNAVAGVLDGEDLGMGSRAIEYINNAPFLVSPNSGDIMLTKDCTVYTLNSEGAPITHDIKNEHDLADLLKNNGGVYFFKQSNFSDNVAVRASIINENFKPIEAVSAPEYKTSSIELNVPVLGAITIESSFRGDLPTNHPAITSAEKAANERFDILKKHSQANSPKVGNISRYFTELPFILEVDATNPRFELKPGARFGYVNEDNKGKELTADLHIGNNFDLFEDILKEHGNVKILNPVYTSEDGKDVTYQEIVIKKEPAQETSHLSDSVEASISQQFYTYIKPATSYFNEWRNSVTTKADELFKSVQGLFNREKYPSDEVEFSPPNSYAFRHIGKKSGLNEDYTGAGENFCFSCDGVSSAGESSKSSKALGEALLSLGATCKNLSTEELVHNTRQAISSVEAVYHSDNYSVAMASCMVSNEKDLVLTVFGDCRVTVYGSNGEVIHRSVDNQLFNDNVAGLLKNYPVFAKSLSEYSCAIQDILSNNLYYGTDSNNENISTQLAELFSNSGLSEARLNKLIDSIIYQQEKANELTSSLCNKSSTKNFSNNIFILESKYIGRGPFYVVTATDGVTENVPQSTIDKEMMTWNLNNGNNANRALRRIGQSAASNNYKEDNVGLSGFMVG